MFKSKKGFIMHPVTWIVVSFFLGALVMYLTAKKLVPIPLDVC